MEVQSVMRPVVLLLVIQLSFCNSLGEQLFLNDKFNDPLSRVIIDKLQRIDDVNGTIAQWTIDVTRALGPESLTQIHKERYLIEDVDLPRADGIDEECTKQFSAYLTGLSNFEMWALKMLDSSSKISSGILTGNMKDLGQYDECISIDEFKQEIGSIKGRHCMYSLSLNLPMKLSQQLSVCMPSACGPEQIRLLLEDALAKISDKVPFAVEVGSVQCSAVESKAYETGEIVTITVFSILLCFLIGCTLYDIFVRITASKKINKTICDFSFYTNLQRIFNTTPTKGTIASIQGIRFYSLCWVILGHEYVTTLLSAVVNMADLNEWAKSWSSVYIFIAPYSVDTFFTLSGFLASYLFIKEMAKGQSFNPILYYLHRYIRLTPALAALILMSIYILPRWGSGAMWESMMVYHSEECKKNWWTMLLYVHNYVNTEHMMCLTHTWYLAVDMQFFWISPLILYPLAKQPKFGLVLLILLIVGSMISPALIIAHYEYPATMGAAMSDSTISMATSGDIMNNFYAASHARAGPWLFGVLLGYILSKKRNPSVKLIVLGWLTTILSFAFIFFTYRIFQGDDYQWNATWEIFYAAVSKQIWAFAICWLIYSSVHGYGGIVSKILSWPIYMPFARISYSVYLVHFIIQIMRNTAGRVPVYFSDETVIYSFFAQFIVSLIGGLALCLVFESPFVALERIIFKKPKRVRIEKNGESHQGLSNGGFVNDNVNCNVSTIVKE